MLLFELLVSAGLNLCVVSGGILIAVVVVQDAARELLKSRGGDEGDDDEDADPLIALDKLYKMDAVSGRVLCVVVCERRSSLDNRSWVLMASCPAHFLAPPRLL